MTDRDRLTMIILDSEILCNTCGENTNSYCAEALADYLLANGVIVPPVKIGQLVYVLDYDEEYDWVDEYKVKYFDCSSQGISKIYIECGTMMKKFRPRDIGKTVFLAKEEAEEKLKELGK